MVDERNAGKGRILVVDDDRLNRIILAAGLHKSGYVVETAEDGGQALEMLSAHPFDMVLLDLVMPGIDGYQVCERIRADDTMVHLPVIFISALEEIGDKVRAFAVGGDDYVTKPFQFAEVLARVETHLALRALQRQLEAANRELARQLQEVQARNEELDAFAHTVAHDLKNPLAAALMCSTMLETRRAGLSEEQIGYYLSGTTRHVRKMTSIVEELLLLAHVRQVEEVQMERLDMGAIVAEAQERLADLIAAQHVQVVIARHWPAALGRGAWVEEVWVNYLSNAIKYGGTPPRIELGYTPSSRAADGAASLGGMPATNQPSSQPTFQPSSQPTVQFWVRDNGPGLPVEEQARLFAPFERLHQVRARGHGLGLSIVRRIVEKLGGQVGVQSEPGRGSLFYFTLPAAPHTGLSVGGDVQDRLVIGHTLQE